MAQPETDPIQTPAHPPVLVIIGAGRSGTNILRDVLCRLSGCGTWPCDEINYIWRYGNAQHLTDELTPEYARPEVARYIQRSVEKIYRKHQLDIVVEKTCANSLRVPFVNAVLPQAKFVHIIRDGRDVAASAAKRWTASLDLPYVLRKARYVPATDVPYYVFRFLKDQLHRLRPSEKRLGAWGPRFEGLDEVLTQHSLLEVCAIQWQRCVEKAEADLAGIPSDRVYRLHYEGFVHAPAEHLDALCGFLDIGTYKIDLSEITTDVTPRSVGNWKSQLSGEEVRSLDTLIGQTLHQLGYAD